MPAEQIGKASNAARPDKLVTLSERLSVSFIVAIFLSIAVRSAYLRPFWFDELSTLFMASRPTLRSMFQAIPTDGNPPLYFLVVRPLLYLPIKTELTLRLPAIGAYLVSSLAIYRFVRSSTKPIFAICSMSIFLGCWLHSYAIEARPYSLLLAFTGLGICSWQSYRRSGRVRYLTGVSAAVAGAIFSHQYGAIYAVLPVAVGEIAATYRRRAIDSRAIIALFLPCTALLFTYPVMLRAQKLLLTAIRICPVFKDRPKWSDLALYDKMLPPIFVLPIALAAFALTVKLALDQRRPANDVSESNTVPVEDLAVALTLSLFLPIMLLATHLGTGFFMARYGIGSAMGLAIAAGLVLAMLPWRYSPSLAWALAVYSTSIGMVGLWLASLQGSSIAFPWNDPVLQAGRPGEQIVVASALEFSPMWWYGRPMRPRLHYLSDLSYAVDHSDVVPEFSLALERDYTPMQMEDYTAFVSSHQHFLLYCYGEPRLEWSKKRLLDEGWRLTLLASAKQNWPNSNFHDNRELYWVSR